MGTWFFSLVRGLFVLIDKIVLWAVETLYGVLIDISTVRIFSSDVLSEFSSRIGTILSIFMLFKLSFSFLTYIINPDQMTDKSKGFAKIIQNIAVSLILLTTYQFLFDKAMDLQMAIINNNTIPKIILGTSVNETTDSNSNPLTYNLFVAFIRPNSTLGGVCDNYGKEVTQACINAANAYTGNLQSGDGYGYFGLAGKQLSMITSGNNTWALLDLMIPVTSGDVFLFDYRFLLSTICCGVVAAVLLTFCLDVSVRMIKLGFLNLIAPIPIISYIDPNKGEGIFKKWLSTVGKVYLDLFIRLIAIWFAIYIIQLLGGNTITYTADGTEKVLTDPFICVFIIIGALMFAKQVPKLIQDITGFNFDSKMQLNPIKRIREEALGGKALVAGAAGLGALGLAGATNLAHRTLQGIRKANQIRKSGGFASDVAKAALGGVGHGIASGVAGAASAGRRAFSHSMKGDGFGKSIWAGDQEAMFAKLQREDLERQGSTLGGRVKADLARKVGVLNAGQQQIIDAGELDNKIEIENQRINSIKSQMVRYKESKIEPLQSLSKTASQIESIVDGDGKVKGAKTYYDSIVNTNGENLTAVRNASEKRDKEYQRLQRLNEGLIKAQSEGRDTRNFEALIKSQTERCNAADANVEEVRKNEISKAFQEFRKTRIDRANELKQEDSNVKVLFDQYEKELNEAISNSSIDDIQKSKIRESYSKGFEGISDANKNIKNYVSTFEITDSEMINYTAQIEQGERWIEETKASREYIDSHNPKSKERADNAARGTKSPQPEGWTPNPRRVDTRTYMPHSVGGDDPFGGAFVGNNNHGGPKQGPGPHNE